MALTHQAMRFIPRISRLGSGVRVALLSAVALLLVTLIFPFKTTIVPEWSLKVVDQTGMSVRAINVTEHWQHYLLETSGHEELQQTGEDGTLTFPARTIRASVLRRSLATLQRLGQDGFNAKRAPYASVVVWGNSDYATTVEVYEPDEGPISKIVVHLLR